MLHCCFLRAGAQLSTRSDDRSRAALERKKEQTTHPTVSHSDSAAVLWKLGSLFDSAKSAVDGVEVKALHIAGDGLGVLPLLALWTLQGSKVLLLCLAKAGQKDTVFWWATPVLVLWL